MTSSKYIKPQAAKSIFTSGTISKRLEFLYKKSGISNLIGFSGTGGKPTLAPTPKRNLAAGARGLTGPMNAGVYIGGDRTGGICDGYSGRGIPAGACDIVAGQMGAYARTHDDDGNPILCNPNFTVDAARCYLAERTDIDAALTPGGLPEGSIGSVKGQSAAALKADSVRLVSRDGGVKICSAMDNRNSGGDKIITIEGIDFICGDDSEMQPAVLGTNLLECLKTMSKQSAEARDIVSSFVKRQSTLNTAIQNHNHNSPFWGITVPLALNLLFPSFLAKFQIASEVEGGQLLAEQNAETDGGNYFNPTTEKFILSAGINVT
jgi:hypothetical protein